MPLSCTNFTNHTCMQETLQGKTANTYRQRPLQPGAFLHVRCTPQPQQGLANDRCPGAALQTINGLGKKAREGTISIDEMAGGTFTISNGGVYGSLLSTPIINPPQSAILGMHSINQRPTVRPISWAGLQPPRMNPCCPRPSSTRPSPPSWACTPSTSAPRCAPSPGLALNHHV